MSRISNNNLKHQMENKRTVTGKNGPIEVEFRDLTQSEFDDMADLIDDRKAETDKAKKRELDHRVGSMILTNYDRLYAEVPRATLQTLVSEGLAWQDREVDTKKSE